MADRDLVVASELREIERILDTELEDRRLFVEETRERATARLAA